MRSASAGVKGVSLDNSAPMACSGVPGSFRFLTSFPLPSPNPLVALRCDSRSVNVILDQVQLHVPNKVKAHSLFTRMH